MHIVISIKGKYQKCILLDQYIFFREINVHNIFTTNLKWQVVTSCYCWGKKVILVLNSNLNQ